MRKYLLVILCLAVSLGQGVAEEMDSTVWAKVPSAIRNWGSVVTSYSDENFKIVRCSYKAYGAKHTEGLSKGWANGSGRAYPGRDFVKIRTRIALKNKTLKKKHIQCVTLGLKSSDGSKYSSIYFQSFDSLSPFEEKELILTSWVKLDAVKKIAEVMVDNISLRSSSFF